MPNISSSEWTEAVGAELDAFCARQHAAYRRSSLHMKPDFYQHARAVAVTWAYGPRRGQRVLRNLTDTYGSDCLREAARVWAAEIAAWPSWEQHRPSYEGTLAEALVLAYRDDDGELVGFLLAEAGDDDLLDVLDLAVAVMRPRGGRSQAVSVNTRDLTKVATRG